jgi:hypothetical protein
MSDTCDGPIGAVRTGLGAVEPTAVSKNENEASNKAVAAMRDVFIGESLNVTDVVYRCGAGPGKCESEF